VKTYKLKELVDIRYGKNHKRLDKGDIPVYGSGGVMRYVNTYLYDKESILIPRKGTLSNLFYLNEPFWSVDTMFYTQIKDIVFPKFLYYYLKGQNLAALDVGSAVPSLTTEVLNKFEVILPESKETQKEIAGILTSLDNKIELNLQMNQTLEAMAQAIFKEWFVDFKFPGFDGELVDGLPKGWRTGKLGDICEIKIGRTPPRMETEWFSLDENDVKWISIKDMGQSGVYILNTSEYLTNDAIERFRIPIIPENTVVLSFKLTVGRLAITTEKMLSNEAIAQLNSEEFAPEYLYSYLKTFNWGSLGSTSSIATAINSNSIKDMDILIPESFVLIEFFEIIKPFFEKIKYNSFQIQSLTKTRDSLLPGLMSGKIEIK
jgi:type I restriction enzyme S subunit